MGEKIVCFKRSALKKGVKFDIFQIMSAHFLGNGACEGSFIIIFQFWQVALASDHRLWKLWKCAVTHEYQTEDVKCSGEKTDTAAKE